MRARTHHSSARESDLPVYRPRYPARAVGRAARPDAEPSLVLAQPDRRAVRVDRSRRLGGVGRRPDSDAQRPAVVPDRRARGRRGIPRPARRGRAESASLSVRAPLVRIRGSGVQAAAIAYFSPEYGITAALPQYSGGLGILAGDHLKSASDLGAPLIGVGLLYTARSIPSRNQTITLLALSGTPQRTFMYVYVVPSSPPSTHFDCNSV